MHKILVISNQLDLFKPFMNTFEKEVYDVKSLKLDEISYLNGVLNHLNFICIHFEVHLSDLKTIISRLHEQTKAPIYLFCKKGTYSYDDRITFYEIGLEGYIEMPFHEKELASHVKAVIRYLNGPRSRVVNLGFLTIDLMNRQVESLGQVQKLTNIEYNILSYLLYHKDQVISKETLIDYAFDNEQSATENALGIHITRLRKKFGKPYTDLLETIWGYGYRLNVALYQKSNDTR